MLLDQATWGKKDREKGFLMLEAKAHKTLKYILQKNACDWPHNLTFSRLVARGLRRRDKSLIHLDSRCYKSWWMGLLVPLAFNSSSVVLVLSGKERSRLLEIEIPRLKSEGVYLALWEEIFPPPSSQVWLLDHIGFINAYRKGQLESRQLIIPEAHSFNGKLRQAMSIKITPKDWDDIQKCDASLDYSLLHFYELLSRRIFINATQKHAKIRLDIAESKQLISLLKRIKNLTHPWSAILIAANEGWDWANWAQLNHTTLTWEWHWQPLEPMQNLQSLFRSNSFLMLNGLDAALKECFREELAGLADCLTIDVTLGDSLNKEPIPLFAPSRQSLPNSEFFYFHLLNQCRRLILGRSGLTIILLDDSYLLRQLASELAGEFGTRVTCETIPRAVNGVICCTCAWWMAYHNQLPIPDQLIIAILPFPNLESPLVSARVESFKRQGRDWFRGFLFPEMLSLLSSITSTIRGKKVRLAILDGRLKRRSWGTDVFRSLEPWYPLNHLLPN